MNENITLFTHFTHAIHHFYDVFCMKKNVFLMLLCLSADKIDFIRDIVALMVVISAVVLVAYDGVVISAKK